MAPTVTKAVIPAAGLGTRFLPATKAQPKEMLPLVDKPAIQYVVEEAVAAGITDVLMITSRSKRSLEDHFDRNLELEHFLEGKGKSEEAEAVRRIAEMVEIHFIRQAEPKGLGHAVGMAASHVGDQPFAVLLGDDIMHERAGVLSGMIDGFARHQTSVVALKQVPESEISSYGCAAAEPLDGRILSITDIVEKPEPAVAPSDLAVMGRYVLTPAVFELLDRQEPGKGGEIQLTDALKELIGGEGLLGYSFTEGRFDTGNKLDYLRATVELALERQDIGPAFRAFLEERLERP